MHVTRARILNLYILFFFFLKNVSSYIPDTRLKATSTHFTRGFPRSGVWRINKTHTYRKQMSSNPVPGEMVQVISSPSTTTFSDYRFDVQRLIGKKKPPLINKERHQFRIAIDILTRYYMNLRPVDGTTYVVRTSVGCPIGSTTRDPGPR